jgi:hypothetical protein
VSVYVFIGMCEDVRVDVCECECVCVCVSTILQ